MKRKTKDWRYNTVLEKKMEGMRLGTQIEALDLEKGDAMAEKR